MSYARRFSTLGHSVAASVVMRVLASSDLRRTLGVSVVLILLLEHILPLVLTPFGMTCEFDDGTTASVQSVGVMVLPLWVIQWFAAAFILILLSNSKHYLPESRLHSCTACWAIAMVAFSTNGSIRLGEWCSSDDTIRRVFFRIRSMTLIGSAGQTVLQFRLIYLRMRVVAGAAPNLVRVGGAFVNAIYAFVVVILISAVWNNHSHSAFSLQLWFLANCCAVLCGFVFTGIYLWAMEISARFAMEEATQVDVDAISASRLVRAARATRFAAFTTLASTLTTVCVSSCAVFWGKVPMFTWYAGYHCVLLADAALNFACVALHSGIACPEAMPVDVWSALQVSAASADAQRRRQIEIRLKGDIGNSTGSALTIAVLMEGFPPEEILEVGRNRFRSISWDILTRRPEIIVGGSPIEGFGPVETNLYSLSQPCRLGQCDVFFSHSWHDADQDQLKWEALKAWCSEFERSHGRKPRIWLDKVCLDQENIDADLRSLPVFLAGSNTLFATSSSTYRSRLWCVMELFVYRMMLVADPSRSPPQVWMLGKDDKDCERQRQEWGRFDVTDSKCFDSRDKERFLRVVSTYPGGAEDFNIFIRNLAVDFEKFWFPNAKTDSYCFNERI